MTSEIGDGLERFAQWLLAIPGSVPILLGAKPHNANLVRAVVALVLITFVVYVISKRPLRSLLKQLKASDGARDKPDGQHKGDQAHT